MLQFTERRSFNPQCPPMDVILHFVFNVSNKALCTGIKNKTNKKSDNKKKDYQNHMYNLRKKKEN